MNSAELEALFAQTLLGDHEDEDAWAAIEVLRQNGSREIFEHAAEWCLSLDPIRRDRGAAILCQLRREHAIASLLDQPDWMFRDESYSLIAKMLEKEQDPVVLDSAISALGHLGNDLAIPLILRHQGHLAQRVRFAVTFALGCFPNHPQSVNGLVALTLDSDSDIRDWAVFGLAVLGDADSLEIRDVLLRCLDDADEDVREEASVGLGKRQDQRLIPKLRAMLDQPELHDRVAEAAAALLGLDQGPPSWVAADYKAALAARFKTGRS